MRYLREVDLWALLVDGKIEGAGLKKSPDPANSEFKIGLKVGH
jgi:hypothetical protein